MSTAVEPTPPTYDLDAEAQQEIVALAMFDLDFLRRTAGLIQPAYFSDLVERGFITLVLEFFAAHKEAPSPAVWVELLKNGFGRVPPLWRDDAKAEVIDRFKALLALEVRNRGFLLEKIEEFAQQQAIMNGLLASAEAMGKKTGKARFDAVKEQMGKALAVKLWSGEDEEYDYFAKIKQRTADRLLVASGGLPLTGITTGVKELDELLYNHRGWGRGELSLFMGPMKSGKSFFLVSCAAAAVQAGYNVLLITLENSAEIQAARIDSYFTGVATRALGGSPHSVEGQIEALRASGRYGRFIMRQYPTGYFSPGHLEALLEEYQAKGVNFDLIVIDYLDIMAPDRRREAKREEHEEVFRKVRGIAGKFTGPRGHPAVLSATQANREGGKAAIVRAEHASEDINKMRLCDICITINRTDEEKATDKARLYIATARNVKDGITLFLKQNLDCGRAIEEVEGIE
jgi:replicative DNA helicase